MHKKQNLERMIRVNQAGEYGAKRIYAGQLAVLEKRGSSPETLAQIRHMAEQEQTHLDTFNDLVAKNQVRPTALQPIWHVAGFALGALTAAMGEKAAMACTVAVEEVIDEHYQQQSAELHDAPELKKIVDQFREEENEHRLTALESGAEQAVGYPVLRKLIRAGSKAAIWLAERI
ncbi:MAG: demethoxyubiquinone hydroxylase family protein [Alphaproteobacteria bacterium]|nr:demethoxyubiquinone hydroxylase family protein [Alphaproteobacteria bacterium]